MTSLPLARPAVLRRPLWQRALYRVPLFGRMAREVAEGPSDTIYYALFTLLCLVVFAVMAWGLPALGLIALATVPGIFVVLLLISFG